MDIERFREYCLSFESVTEKAPFTEKTSFGKIQLNFGGEVSDSEIPDLVKQSYEIVNA